jgi:hypothetical protein
MDALDMIEGMIAYPMASGQHLTKQLGMLAHVIAHHEEGGPHAIMIKLI